MGVNFNCMSREELLDYISEYISILWKCKNIQMSSFTGLTKTNLSFENKIKCVNSQLTPILSEINCYKMFCKIPMSAVQC